MIKWTKSSDCCCLLYLKMLILISIYLSNFFQLQLMMNRLVILLVVAVAITMCSVPSEGKIKFPFLYLLLILLLLLLLLLLLFKTSDNLKLLIKTWLPLFFASKFSLLKYQMKHILYCLILLHDMGKNTWFSYLISWAGPKSAIYTK